MRVLADTGAVAQRGPIVDESAHLFKSFRISILLSMKIAVVGTGYVGLVLGACLAENGNDVTCVDKDASKIRLLESGGMPMYEPGLEEMVRRNHAEDRLTYTTDLASAAAAAEIVFIAVGTPQGEDGSAD